MKYTFEGVTVQENDIRFFSQAGEIEQKITLNIVALELVKNKEYTTNIKIETLFETLSIPVKLKAVFPKKAYITMLVKYAIICAVGLGAMRFLIGLMTSHDGWLSDDAQLRSYFYLDADLVTMPSNYFLYFIGLVIFLFVVFRSFFLIKKYEKL